MQAKLKALEKQYSSSIGYTYAILSSLFFVVGHYFVQKASVHMKPFQVLYLVSLQLAIYNYGTLSYQNKSPHSTKPRTTRMLIFRGVFGFCAGIFFQNGLPLAPLSQGVVVQMTGPVITGIMATFLLGEKYDLTLVLTTIFSFSGVLLISKPDFIFGETVINANYPFQNLGIMLLLISSVLGSVNQIIIKRLGSISDSYTISLFLGVCCGSGAGLGHLFQGVGEVRIEPFIWMAIVGFLRYISHTFMNKSYAFGEAGKISLMSYSQVPMAYLIDLVIVGNKPDMYSIIGSLCVFSSFFVMLYKQLKSKK